MGVKTKWAWREFVVAVVTAWTAEGGTEDFGVRVETAEGGTEEIGVGVETAWAQEGETSEFAVGVKTAWREGRGTEKGVGRIDRVMV